MTAVAIIVGLLFLAGVIGSFLPFIPGTPLVLLGAVVYAAATDWTPVGPGRLVLLGVLTVLSYVLHYVTGALGARRYGGSGWAVAGALAGAVVGVFLGPLGLIVGPIAGAVGAELLRSGNLPGSLRSGVGALVGVLIGAAANFALAVVMVALFFWWVWRG
jgi:uncharacterized protein YqgC (DUF456 family)